MLGVAVPSTCLHTLHAHTAALLPLLLCSLIKDFEREARADGMDQKELTDRRRFMADELNRFINMKKDFTSSEAGKGELFDGAGGGAAAEAELKQDGARAHVPCLLCTYHAGLMHADELVALVGPRKSPATGHAPGRVHGVGSGCAC